MIIESLFGLVLTIGAGGDTKMDPASIIYKGVVTGNRIIQKENVNKITETMTKTSEQPW